MILRVVPRDVVVEVGPTSVVEGTGPAPRSIECDDVDQEVAHITHGMLRPLLGEPFEISGAGQSWSKRAEQLLRVQWRRSTRTEELFLGDPAARDREGCEWHDVPRRV